MNRFLIVEIRDDGSIINLAIVCARSKGDALEKADELLQAWGSQIQVFDINAIDDDWLYSESG